MKLKFLDEFELEDFESDWYYLFQDIDTKKTYYIHAYSFPYDTDDIFVIDNPIVTNVGGFDIITL